jgi:hypothetical protein
MKTQATVSFLLKNERIGNVVLELSKTTNGEHIVTAVIHGPETSEVVKTWDFKNPSTGESMSHYFFDYAVREVQQHAYSSTHSIPNVLLNMTTKDAEAAIESVLLHLSK